MRIRYAASAKQDLSDIQDYIAQDDQAAAYRLAQRVKSQISRLAQYPYLGRPGQIEGTRELSISGTPYFAVYRIKRRTIEVLTVVHSRRQWPP
jgi:toxin ParE1/3/4